MKAHNELNILGHAVQADSSGMFSLQEIYGLLDGGRLTPRRWLSYRRSKDKLAFYQQRGEAPLYRATLRVSYPIATAYAMALSADFSEQVISAVIGDASVPHLVAHLAAVKH